MPVPGPFAPATFKIEESGADIVVTDCETCKWQIEMSTSKRCEHPITSEHGWINVVESLFVE
jgi:hypothetical protein